MKPISKILILTFSLILGFIALAYFALRYRTHPVAIWFPLIALSYIVAAIIIAGALRRSVSRLAQPEKVEKPTPVRQGLRKAWTVYVVAAGSGLLLQSMYVTLKGRAEWRRTLPFMVFVLLFIALFAWRFRAGSRT